MREGRTPQETTADMWRSGYWKQSKMAFLVASLVGALGRAVTSRLHSLGVPDRKITAKGGLGKGGGWLQDKVGGLISRAKKTLPSCPGLLGKLWEQKQGAVRDSPSRSLWEAEINRVWSQPGLSVTSDTAGILVSSCKGELLTKLLNFLTPVFKDKSVRGVTVAI